MFIYFILFYSPLNKSKSYSFTAVIRRDNASIEFLFFTWPIYSWIVNLNYFVIHAIFSKELVSIFYNNSSTFGSFSNLCRCSFLYLILLTMSGYFFAASIVANKFVAHYSYLRAVNTFFASISIFDLVLRTTVGAIFENKACY